MPTEWPHIVKDGNASVPIYKIERATGYPEFKVVYYAPQPDGTKKRRFKTCAEFADAKKFASNVNAALNKGDSRTLILSGDELHAYQEAVAVLAGTGKTLIQAAHEYADAIRALNGTPLAVCVDGYRRAFARMQTKTVQAVVDELIETKRTNKKKPASEVYLKDLRGRLDKFADSFNVNIDEVTTKQIEEWLFNLKGSGRTQFNYGRLIGTLFSYAEKCHYLPKDSNPFDDVDNEFEDDTKIEIYTPAEMRAILDAARPELIPFLALGAFAGLRHAEIRRLDWADINGKVIRIEKAKSKTRQNRVIELQPNLSKWLAPHRKESGPVIEFVHVSKQLGWLAEDVTAKAREQNPNAKAFEWRHNALRHSFVSYSFALHGARQTSIEAGHSETMLFQNYRELVTADAAREWFSIEPQSQP